MQAHQENIYVIQEPLKIKLHFSTEKTMNKDSENTSQWETVKRQQAPFQTMAKAIQIKKKPHCHMEI